MLIGSSVPSAGDSPAAAFRRAEYCRAPAGLCVVSAEKAQLCPAPEIKRAVVQFGMALGQLESNGMGLEYLTPACPDLLVSCWFGSLCSRSKL